MKNGLSLLLFVFLFLSSCANLSKNTISEGKIIVRNGAFGDKIWNENLEFKRISWTHELTLQFDLMIATPSPQSGFYFWFSKGELDSINKCGDFRIVLAYSLDTKMLPYSYLNEEIQSAGFQKIDLVGFRKNFLQHPDAEFNSFRLYQIYGICRSSKEGKPLIFSFPGYSEKALN